MNLEKYKNDGWGLSKLCFLHIKEILDDIDKPIIVEFGSGISTEFLVDYLNLNKKDGKIYSFDNDEKFSAKITDDKLDLKILDLVECNDIDFNLMFYNKAYDESKMKLRKQPPHTRQKNCFYNIEDEYIPKNVDLVILDGSHGNGRSIAYLHLINKLNDNSYIIVDDYTHYNFSELLKQVFPKSEMIFESNSGNVNQWELGGNFRIFKIVK
jgi:hypothetical protein